MATTSSQDPNGSGASDLAALKSLLAAGGGAASSGKVYMGSVSQLTGKNQDYLSGPAIIALGKRKQPVWMSTDEAENDYYNWTTKRQGDFVSQGIVSGLLKLGDGPLEGATLWKKLVKEASNYGSNGKEVSPYDLLASYVKSSGGGNAWTSAGVWQVNTVTGERKYAGPGTYLGGGKASQVDTRVDLTDPDTAKAVSTKVFQDLMGRDPGAGELTAFASALHSAEEANPVVQNTTTQYDTTTGQALSSSTSSSGGVTSEGQQYLQQQQIKGKKEYGAYQAATTYQNALDALVFGSGA